jgi:hypothetical protein
MFAIEYSELVVENLKQLRAFDRRPRGPMKMDDEQVQLGSSPEFWKLIEESRKQKNDQPGRTREAARRGPWVIEMQDLIPVDQTQAEF